MDDRTVIVFSFPRTALVTGEVAEKMGVIQDQFKDSPEVKIYSVVGGSAEKIVGLLEKDPEKEDSNLVLHAMRELALAGNDEDFNTSIISAVEAFASYGHSGGSASVAIPMLYDLLNYKNLTPLTDNPKEWMQVEMDDENCWQSVRNPEAFSGNGGKTYYLLSESVEGQPALKHETIRSHVS